MTDASIAANGVTRFVADLDEEGHRPYVDGDVVMYHVVPVAGARAGREIVTGVGAGELQGWSMAPPHWIHLEVGVTFPSTNTDTQSCPPGWRRHSFDTGAWVLNRKPIHLWIAHVRGVLSQAV